MANQNQNPNKSNEPSNSSFKQQTFPAYHPIFDAKAVFPIYLLTSLIFLPIGIGILIYSQNVNEVVIEYESCKANYMTAPPNKECDEIVRDSKNDCQCTIPFEIPFDLDGKIFIYYRLTNFYQNHRLYMTSKDDNQLLGKIYNNATMKPIPPSNDCEPLDKVESKLRLEDLYYFPCGQIANSMFNDDIKLFHLIQPDEGKVEEIPVKLSRTGIIYEPDKSKYKNPDMLSDRNHTIWKHFVKPPLWKKELWELDTENEENNGLKNEDFIVWMRIAALPDFRKLFRLVDSKSNDTNVLFKNGLPKGKYKLDIDYNFQVKSFGGTKAIIITNNSIIGAKNPFLGLCYIAVGAICLILFLMTLTLSFHNRKQM